MRGLEWFGVVKPQWRLIFPTFSYQYIRTFENFYYLPTFKKNIPTLHPSILSSDSHSFSPPTIFFQNFYNFYYFIHPSIQPFIHPSIYLSIHPSSIHPSIPPDSPSSTWQAVSGRVMHRSAADRRDTKEQRSTRVCWR